MVEQPGGTVTLPFTDIEGSTRLLDELCPDSYREALGEHRRLLRAAFERHAGDEVDYAAMDPSTTIESLLGH